jgi:peptide/nickel transport system substrate-binding protein
VTDNTAADLDPASDEFYGSDTIARNIDDELIALDHSSLSHFIPKLATSWSSNADKSVWTFYLRHGVVFHTGRCCMTAADVKYSVERTVLAGLSAAYMFGRFLINPEKQIKVIDPYTIEFDLGRPQPVFASAIASEFTALILDSKALQAHVKNHDWGHAYATDHDLGTGPYKIQSWIHSQETTLVRFPQYWGGWSGRHFSKIVIRTVPEDTTRRELLEKGQADLTYNLTPQDDQALSKNPKVKVSVNYSTEVDYVTMTEWGPLASPYARQAMAYAFDYNALINGFYRGYARRAYGCVPSTLLGYDPHMFHYQTNLAKAKELLQKAGVKPGTTLTFTFADPYQPVGLIMQAQLAQIGITLKLQHVDAAAFQSVYFGNEPASQRPAFMPYPWWPDYNDPWDMCEPLIASYAAGAAGANAGYYHDKQVDALLAQMKYAGREKLAGLAQRLQDVTGRIDPPAIWVDQPLEVTVMARHLQGFTYNALVQHTFDFYQLHR